MKTNHMETNIYMVAEAGRARGFDPDTSIEFENKQAMTSDLFGPRTVVLRWKRKQPPDVCLAVTRELLSTDGAHEAIIALMDEKAELPIEPCPWGEKNEGAQP